MQTDKSVVFLSVNTDREYDIVYWEDYDNKIPSPKTEIEIIEFPWNKWI